MQESEHILRRAKGGWDHVRPDQQHGGPGERGGLRLGIQRQRTGNPGHPCCRAAYAYNFILNVKKRVKVLSCWIQKCLIVSSFFDRRFVSNPFFLFAVTLLFHEKSTALIVLDLVLDASYPNCENSSIFWSEWVSESTFYWFSGQAYMVTGAMLTLPDYTYFDKGLHTFSKPRAPFALPLGGVWPDPESGVLVHLSSESDHY